MKRPRFAGSEAGGRAFLSGNVSMAAATRRALTGIVWLAFVLAAPIFAPAWSLDY